VVDEAQLFAPAVGGEVSDEARKLSLGAMTNLMCRGRKRGLAGVIATQRLAKLAKNVAAEGSNFLMGRTFLDIDMQRAADLLGLERRQAEVFRELERGRFVALGPALSRRPLQIAVGPVETVARGSTPGLTPPPAQPTEDERDLLLASAPVSNQRPPGPRRRASQPTPTLDLLAAVDGEAAATDETPDADADAMPEEEREAAYRRILADIMAEPEANFRSEPVLYQDFLVHCRIRRIGGPQLDLAGIRSRLIAARAGISPDRAESAEWAPVLAVAQDVAEDLRGVYFLLARAAMDRLPCPSDMDLAQVCASHSPGRGRSRLQALEQGAFIVLRKDMRGGRIVVLPDLQWETAPGDAAAQAGVNLAGATTPDKAAESAA